MFKSLRTGRSPQDVLRSPPSRRARSALRLLKLSDSVGAAAQVLIVATNYYTSLARSNEDASLDVTLVMASSIVLALLLLVAASAQRMDESAFTKVRTILVPLLAITAMVRHVSMLRSGGLGGSGGGGHASFPRFGPGLAHPDPVQCHLSKLSRASGAGLLPSPTYGRFLSLLNPATLWFSAAFRLRPQLKIPLLIALELVFWLRAALPYLHPSGKEAFAFCAFHLAALSVTVVVDSVFFTKLAWDVPDVPDSPDSVATRNHRPIPPRHAASSSRWTAGPKYKTESEIEPVETEVDRASASRVSGRGLPHSDPRRLSGPGVYPDSPPLRRSRHFALNTTTVQRPAGPSASSACAVQCQAPAPDPSPLASRGSGSSPGGLTPRLSYTAVKCLRQGLAHSPRSPGAMAIRSAPVSPRPRPVMAGAGAGQAQLQLDLRFCRPGVGRAESGESESGDEGDVEAYVALSAPVQLLSWAKSEDDLHDPDSVWSALTTGPGPALSAVGLSALPDGPGFARLFCIEGCVLLINVSHKLKPAATTTDDSRGARGEIITHSHSRQSRRESQGPGSGAASPSGSRSTSRSRADRDRDRVSGSIDGAAPGAWGPTATQLREAAPSTTWSMGGQPGRPGVGALRVVCRVASQPLLCPSDTSLVQISLEVNHQGWLNTRDLAAWRPLLLLGPSPGVRIQAEPGWTWSNVPAPGGAVQHSAAGASGSESGARAHGAQPPTGPSAAPAASPLRTVSSLLNSLLLGDRASGGGGSWTGRERGATVGPSNPPGLAGAQSHVITMSVRLTPDLIEPLQHYLGAAASAGAGAAEDASARLGGNVLYVGVEGRAAGGVAGVSEMCTLPIVSAAVTAEILARPRSTAIALSADLGALLASTLSATHLALRPKDPPASAKDQAAAAEAEHLALALTERLIKYASRNRLHELYCFLTVDLFRFERKARERAPRGPGGLQTAPAALAVHEPSPATMQAQIELQVAPLATGGGESTERAPATEPKPESDVFFRAEGLRAAGDEGGRAPAPARRPMVSPLPLPPAHAQPVLTECKSGLDHESGAAPPVPPSASDSGSSSCSSGEPRAQSPSPTRSTGGPRAPFYKAALGHKSHEPAALHHRLHRSPQQARPPVQVQMAVASGQFQVQHSSETLCACVPSEGSRGSVNTLGDPYSVAPDVHLGSGQAQAPDSAAELMRQDVRMNPVLLTFSDPSLEREFLLAWSRSRRAIELSLGLVYLGLATRRAFQTHASLDAIVHVRLHSLHLIHALLVVARPGPLSQPLRLPPPLAPLLRALRLQGVNLQVLLVMLMHVGLFWGHALNHAETMCPLDAHMHGLRFAWEMCTWAAGIAFMGGVYEVAWPWAPFIHAIDMTLLVASYLGHMGPNCAAHPQTWGAVASVVGSLGALTLGWVQQRSMRRRFLARVRKEREDGCAYLKKFE